MIEFYLAFALIALWTIRNLPFINMEAAFKFQYWILDLIRKLEEWANR